jgi:hypothetical protein
MDKPSGYEPLYGSPILSGGVVMNP